MDGDGLYAARPRPCFFNPAAVDVLEHPIAYDLDDLSATNYDDDDRSVYEMIVPRGR